MRPPYCVYEVYFWSPSFFVASCNGLYVSKIAIYEYSSTFVCTLILDFKSYTEFSDQYSTRMVLPLEVLMWLHLCMEEKGRMVMYIRKDILN